MAAPGESSAEIEPERLVAWMAQDGIAVQVIDVRERHERDAGHIAGTRHIELMELPAHASEVDRQRPVVLYCRVGNRSLMAAQALRASGYDAYSLSGGLLRWAQEGRPLSPPDGYVAEH